MPALKNGDKAPDFEALDQDGNILRLADFRGRPLFLFFYPKANTSG
jgi:peroxiredoxin Q/BCP